ncbi:MAG: hypothetical protein KF832_06985 [Caldilineaceae bacterium]|nr:hypothetical protein [Caldilineaceae bacterium]
MIGTVIVAGSALTFGFYAYQRQPTDAAWAWWRIAPKRLVSWLGTPSARPPAQANTQLVAVTVASCTAMVGTLWFPPLKLVSVAGLLCMGAPAAQAAYTALAANQRITPALFESVVLAVILQHGYLVMGSLGFTGYHLGRAVLATHAAEEPLPTGALPAFVRVERAGAELEIQWADLLPSDHIIVRASELVAVQGTVVEGLAWVDQRLDPASPTPIVVRSGSPIAPANLVLLGCITIEQAA